MTDLEKERRRAVKRRFILGGVVVGTLLSAGYLALNLTGRSITGGAALPDPLGVRCLNLFLIIAASVLQASILGRAAGQLTEKRRGAK